MNILLPTLSGKIENLLHETRNEIHNLEVELAKQRMRLTTLNECLDLVKRQEQDQPVK